MYFDGQFDDARLLIALAITAEQHGAALANYCPVIGLTKDDEGFVSGLRFVDSEGGREHEIYAKVVINATGAFSDAVRQIDDPTAEPMIAPSQGVHIVLDRSFLPGDSAIMVPRTNDGRVMFAIPWNGSTLVGTTDTPVDKLELEPVAMEQEIDFLLSTAARYLARDPHRSDIKSVWAGIRPLVKAGNNGNTAALSRDHTIHVSPSGLLTIAGGKWTTYRRMAKDAVNHAAMLAHLDERPCVTEDLPIHRPEEGDEVLRAVRQEMARTVDDVLSRRTRLLVLDARAAIAKAPSVAATMAKELGRGEAWRQEQVASFQKTASSYVARATSP
jgi:glycerol-3-phosphate dehydrogenase